MGHCFSPVLAGQALAHVVACLVVAWSPAAARADWVNLTGAEVAPNIAEIRIDNAGVRVDLEIYYADRHRFATLLAARRAPDMAKPESPGGVALPRFAREGLMIRSGDDRVLVPRLMSLQPRARIDRRSAFAGMIDPKTGRRLPAPPADKRVYFAQLFYPFQTQKPASLSFTPPRGADGSPSVSIGMIVFHRHVPVIDFRYLGAEATLRLDWSDPWFSKFDHPNLARHHRYPRMTFLYVEPYEVRHEALLRVRDVASLVGLSLPNARFTATAAKDLIEAASSFVGERSPMTVDGKAVKPDFDRAAFMRIGVRGLEIIQPGEAIDVDSALLGLIWSTPVDGYPKSATVEWTLFDQRSPTVPAYAIDAAGPLLASLSQDQRLLSWTNYFKKPPHPAVASIVASGQAQLRFPLFSAVCWVFAGLTLALIVRGRLTASSGRIAGAIAAAVLVAVGASAMGFGTIGFPRPDFMRPHLSEAEARPLTQQLLKNVYRAFDFRGEYQVYDRLAKTVDGALLEEVYLKQRRALRIARAGGAQARVKLVQVKSAMPIAGPTSAAAFTVRARWIVAGQVGHWGHVHQRVNAYNADITVSGVSGVWKITGFDVIAQERLS